MLLSNFFTVAASAGSQIGGLLLLIGGFMFLVWICTPPKRRYRVTHGTKVERLK